MTAAESKSPVVVLFIDRSDSRCGACGQTALPREPAHTTPCGYDHHDGCGATYTHLSSNYMGEAQKRSCMAMRPDLPWMDYAEAHAAARDLAKAETGPYLPTSEQPIGRGPGPGVPDDGILHGLTEDDLTGLRHDPQPAAGQSPALTLPDGWEDISGPAGASYRVDPAEDAPLVYALPGCVEVMDWALLPDEAIALAARLIEAAAIVEQLRAGAR